MNAFPTYLDAAKPTLSAFMDKNSGSLGNLYGRWQDEKNYEDFADYAKVMQQIAETEPSFRFVAASKHPFGFTVEHLGMKQLLKVTISSRAINLTLA